VQYCTNCGRIACRRHAFTNLGLFKSVCNECMKDAFPWIAAAEVEIPENWEYSVSPWEVLGVQPGATAEEIKTAYRAAAKQSHSDHGGDEGAMVMVNRAFEVLKDVV
jgi:DnaJ-class molecular chaperone